MFCGEIFDTENIEDYFGFVYLIIHHITNKKYIGKKFFWSRRTLKPLKGKKRKRKVIKESNWKDYYGSCSALIDDLEKYGYDKCTREILSIHKDERDVNYSEVKEQFKYDVLEKTDEDNNRIFYNSNILSRYFVRPEFISIETRRKMSISQKGKKLSQETKNKISEATKGKPKPKFSLEHKNNLSTSLKGRDAWNKGMSGMVEVSDITKEKMRNSHKKLPDDNPAVLARYKEGHVPHNTGKTLSVDTKNKISNTLKTTSHFINNNPNAASNWGAIVEFEDKRENIDNFSTICQNNNIKYNALCAWSKKHLDDNKLHPKYNCKILEIYKLERE